MYIRILIYMYTIIDECVLSVRALVCEYMCICTCICRYTHYIKLMYRVTIMWYWKLDFVTSLCVLYKLL